ncbi:hypothetical protein H2202_009559 [Exophiala xenobiotica]|nr:hypothetical protein H2202_009559 [Exophiala xenobiotica]KAK5374880.1 hypothetical protein LTS13_005448 [Exophiala xenobiotica]KAK5397031.1 hypothetical protein LTR79_005667 [Exophiala xenobiotica]KAK5415351.1 hypothetical protein LTR90_006401 [Exophiala xenobiotica]KAK5470910.1 hypothetical protein LTR20_001171 [Exophiala xenobiotica]
MQADVLTQATGTDGGGVRGYSMLVILQELMHRVYVESEGKPPTREATPKPCDYFDLIVGTGTGGLIAIMLGRLRLDLETCMNVYVRMTKRVFETDKTIAGIPYKHTLFKASKLEEAIRECVRDHTVFEDEGNDGTSTGGREFGDLSSPASTTSATPVRRSMSIRSSNSISMNGPSTMRNSIVSPTFSGWGNPNASLYDGRENRTKTAVTAVYQGTPKNGSPALLRSYDSRKEPPPEYHCTIWQAGRATCATGLAFKPIQIGQTVFIDEGAGQYNPAVTALEETISEWPAREIGVFVSVGTGKRPEGSGVPEHEWWEEFLGGSMGMFAEARRRLISKIEACEATHQQMLKTELAKRGVPQEVYYRFNATSEVGSVGMNEWAAVSTIQTNTRKYLRQGETQRLLGESATKMGKIEVMKRRQERGERGDAHSREPSWSHQQKSLPLAPSIAAVHSGAVELPAEVTTPFTPTQHVRTPGNPPYPSDAYASSQDKFVMVPGETKSPRASAEMPYRSGRNDDKFFYQPQPPGPPPPPPSHPSYNPSEPPPRPPKTPINEPSMPARQGQRTSPMHTNSGRPNGAQAQAQAPRPPYPLDDHDAGPPPIVSKLRKPEYTPR